MLLRWKLDFEDLRRQLIGSSAGQRGRKTKSQYSNGMLKISPIANALADSAWNCIVPHGLGSHAGFQVLSAAGVPRMGLVLVHSPSVQL